MNTRARQSSRHKKCSTFVSLLYFITGRGAGSEGISACIDSFSFGLPLAIGQAVARLDREVSLTDGDRSLGEGNMARCDACGALTPDAHVLEVEGGPTSGRGVVAVRIGLCGSCYLRPERGQIVNRLCAEVLVPPPYWFDRPSAWSSTIREVRSPRGRRTHLFHFLYEAAPFSTNPERRKPA